MEFSVNDLLKEDVVRISKDLLPPGVQGDMLRVRDIQNAMAQIIDTLGKLSTLEQGLNKVITSSETLQKAPTQSIYLIKDSSANGGKGIVFGLLKVGKKHLYLFDEKDVVREVEPLCVLDFFIRPEYQRHGHGRRLFDFMLQVEGVRVEQLAVDGPSPKMESFLAKNYGLHQLVRQNNNFAVAPTFFSANKELGEFNMNGENEKSGLQVSHSRMAGGRFYRHTSPPSDKEPHKITPQSSGRLAPPAPEEPIGRYAAHKPTSCIGNVIHGIGSSAGGDYPVPNYGRRRAMNMN